MSDATAALGRRWGTQTGSRPGRPKNGKDQSMATLNDAALDLLFREARTHTAWLDELHVDGIQTGTAPIIALRRPTVLNAAQNMAGAE